MEGFEWKGGGMRLKFKKTVAAAVSGSVGGMMEAGGPTGAQGREGSYSRE